LRREWLFPKFKDRIMRLDIMPTKVERSVGGGEIEYWGTALLILLSTLSL
jgi:hypothetical protein